MATTTGIAQNSDSDLASASDAIDQMISMSIANHNPDVSNQNSDKTMIEQTSITRQNCSPRLVQVLMLSYRIADNVHSSLLYNCISLSSFILEFLFDA